ncbi:tRNA-methyltransferase [Mrakia frigida]|uniref:tRNA-5-taurinomethyluridine 2-sulfurtransferase n=1 Tax=Mrakia frigida TaxID=29902 RepID=UPI003FCC1A69
MSGGVDSSLTLKLLSQQDLDLSAVFMRNWTSASSDSIQGCEWEADWQDVQIICKQLDVPCRMIDLSREYWTRVFEPALEDWAGGLTPNPDVACNKEIKFGALMEKGLVDRNAFLATGHYARLEHTPSGQTRLLSALDVKKDQSYFLSSVPESKLARSIFPLGNLQKTEVKRLAAEYHLHTADRKESTGLCFVEPKQKFTNFLDEFIPPNPGPVYHENGTLLGQHQGLWSHAIGQRYKIAGRGASNSEKMFVAGKDLKENAIWLVEGSNHPALLTPFFRAHSWSWIHEEPPPEVYADGCLPVQIKIFSTKPPLPGTLRRSTSTNLAGQDEFRLDYDAGVLNQVATPGQVVVVYLGDWCLGSGIISEREWIFETPSRVGGERTTRTRSMEEKV